MEVRPERQHRQHEEHTTARPACIRREQRVDGDEGNERKALRPHLGEPRRREHGKADPERDAAGRGAETPGGDDDEAERAGDAADPDQDRGTEPCPRRRLVEHEV